MSLKCQHSKQQPNQSQDRKPEGSGEKLLNELIHPIVQETTKAEKPLTSLLNKSQTNAALLCSHLSPKKKEENKACNFSKFRDSLLIILVNILFKLANVKATDAISLTVLLHSEEKRDTCS